MQVLRLIQANNFDLPYELSEEIGYGADGQVFNLIDFPDRVIKLSVLYDSKICENPRYEDIDMVLSYLECHKPDTCARVYIHKYLGCGEETCFIGTRKFLLYYYIMEKLFKTTEDERKVFHSILSHEDRKIVKNFSDKTLRKMLEGMALGLEFDHDKILRFCFNLRNSRIKHLDTHVRNIMKDAEGNFKLIDFDRISLGDNK